MTRGVRGKFPERLERLFVLLHAGHEDGRVVAGNTSEFLRIPDAEDSRLQQVLERAVIVLDAKLTQPEKGVRRAVLGSQAHDFPEDLPALRKVVE